MSRLLAVAMLIATVNLATADEKKMAAAIVELPSEKGDKIQTRGGKPTAPTVITTAEELEKAIPDEDTRTRIKKLVDFKQQTLLVFAWQGSGQDKISYAVAESFPEQITFTYLPGRTRDLRPHVYLFAIRNNVKWSAR